MRITTVNITPVAVKDPPLLNSMGLHRPYALRAIIEVDLFKPPWLQAVQQADIRGRG